MTEKGAEGGDAPRSWPQITMYSTSWCGDCRASRQFMLRNGVPFTEYDIEEDPSKAETVVKLNDGMRRVPTIIIEGGPTLVEPINAELGRALGIG
jgi:mycoredoxin